MNFLPDSLLDGLMPVLTLEELACFYPWALNQLTDADWLFIFFTDTWTDKKLADSWQFPPVESIPRDTDFAQFMTLCANRAYNLWLSCPFYDKTIQNIMHNVNTRLHLEPGYLSNTVLEIYLKLCGVEKRVLHSNGRHLYNIKFASQ